MDPSVGMRKRKWTLSCVSQTEQSGVKSSRAAEKRLAERSETHRVARVGISFLFFLCPLPLFSLRLSSLLSCRRRLRCVCESLGRHPSVEWIEAVQQQRKEGGQGVLPFQNPETPVWNQSAIALLTPTHAQTHTF